jgi:hypothetical protein
MGSSRVFRGFHIAMDNHGNIAPGVFFVDPQECRNELEKRIGRAWAELYKEGWSLVEIEGWSVI